MGAFYLKIPQDSEFFKLLESYDKDLQPFRNEETVSYLLSIRAIGIPRKLSSGILCGDLSFYLAVTFTARITCFSCRNFIFVYTSFAFQSV
jgi:hypothetical protein